MTVAVVLVLVGSATHAAWNLLASRMHTADPRLFVWVYSLMSAVLLIPVVGVMLLAGADASWSLVWASAVSAAFHTGYALSLQSAYSRSDVNVTYPVARGLGPVLVALLAVVAFGDRLSWAGWLGIALITAGVAVVSTGAAGADTRARRLAGVRWGLLIAAAIATYTLWDAYVVAERGLDPVLYYCGTGAWMCLVLTAASFRRRSAALTLAREHWRPALVVAVLVPVSYVLVLIALTMAPVVVVAPLRSTSIVLGSLAAWLWLGETQGARRLVGAVVVTIGVAALVLGSA